MRRPARRAHPPTNPRRRSPRGRAGPRIRRRSPASAADRHPGRDWTARSRVDPARSGEGRCGRRHRQPAPRRCVSSARRGTRSPARPADARTGPPPRGGHSASVDQAVGAVGSIPDELTARATVASASASLAARFVSSARSLPAGSLMNAPYQRPGPARAGPCGVARIYASAAVQVAGLTRAGAWPPDSAEVAQLVEQPPCKRQVRGSSPLFGSQEMPARTGFRHRTGRHAMFAKVDLRRFEESGDGLRLWGRLWGKRPSVVAVGGAPTAAHSVNECRGAGASETRCPTWRRELSAVLVCSRKPSILFTESCEARNEHNRLMGNRPEPTIGPGAIRGFSRCACGRCRRSRRGLSGNRIAPSRDKASRGSFCSLRS